MNRLTSQQKELKQQLSTGEYKTLVSWVLDRVGWVLQRLIRRSVAPPYWVSALAIGIAGLALRLLGSLLLDNGTIRDHSYWMLIFEGPLVAVALVSLVALREYDAFIVRVLEQNIIDQIETAQDLDNLRDWLIKVYSNKGKCFLFALLTSAGVMYYVIFFWVVWLRLPEISYGASALFFLVLLQAGIYVYYVIMLADFSLRVRKYQFQLHKVSPGESRIIHEIASIQTPLVYMTVGFATLSTIYFAIGNILTWSNILLALMGGWLPLSILFVSSQIGLGELIGRAKRRTLYELHTEIDRLHKNETPPSKKTLEHLQALVEYYEVVRAKPNSALDLRAVLGYVYNLLLPLLGILLANLDKLIAFVRELSSTILIR